MRYVMSLGGSVMVPADIDVEWLSAFKEVITKHIRLGKFFTIICGGGATSRTYQAAAANLTRLDPEDVDWLGIHATRLNAHLLRTIFRDFAYPRIIKNPKQAVRTRKSVLIGAGWKPGRSTDYCAVMLAKRLGIHTILNISDIDYVYTADPKKHRDARPIERLDWATFIDMLPKSWSPGLHSPFDPVAARLAARSKLMVVVMGPDTANLDALLSGKKFTGTVIGPE